jgi:hypothetical protein
MLPSAARRLPRRWLPALVALAGLVIGAGCESVPLTAPAGTGITLLASPASLSVNGAATITAVLNEGAFLPDPDGGGTTIDGVGTPVHNGTVVTFVTSLGRMQPAEARTVGGRAQATLIADGRSGVAVITAFSGGASQMLEVPIGDVSAATTTTRR